MGAFIDGWQVLQTHFAVFAAVTACALWGSALVMRLLGGARAFVPSLAERLSLGVTAWLPPALLLAALYLLTARWLGAAGATLLLVAQLALTTVPIAWRIRMHPSAAAPRAAAGLLIAATIALVVLRLAFVRDLVLPQYFDSATHYGLIRGVLEWAEGSNSGHGLVLPVAPYYHLGYHILMGGMASAAQLDIGALMLVSGQLILALTPLALYAPAHRLTGSAIAGAVAVALAATGWYMPAFAANWGKYPALFAVLPAIGALTSGLLAFQSAADAQARRRWLVLSLVLTVTTGLLHTRTILVVAAGALAALFALRLRRLPAGPRRLALGLSLLGLFVLTWMISAVPALSPALEPYVGTGLLATATVLLLCIAALHYRPDVSQAICLFLVFMLAGLIIPSGLPGFGSVFDRPFVELWIFAPLSLLGGVGFAGLSHHLSQPAARTAAVIICGALVVHALVAYDPRASSCCTTVTGNDMVALDWLDRNLRIHDLVAIATEPLQLGVGSEMTLEAPVDAGAWIKPLTGLGVVPLRYDADLGASAVVQDLCEHGARYIYLGGSPRAFDAERLRLQPRRFAVRLQLPGASVVEILECRD
jgi:hypothetical protein